MPCKHIQRSKNIMHRWFVYARPYSWNMHVLSRLSEAEMQWWAYGSSNWCAISSTCALTLAASGVLFSFGHVLPLQT